MTKDKALHAFMESFGMDAYPVTSVPKDAKFPYLTYEYVDGSFESGEVSIPVNLWFYTESEATPNNKAQEIARQVGRGGVMVPCDGGEIWVKRGSPWVQSMADDSNPMIKRRYINMVAEYFTEN